MGPTDSKRPVLPSHSPGHATSPSAHGHPVSHLGDRDHIPPAPCHADPADGLATQWESAWIDLGGEG